jgi:hypothetical protein
MPFIGNQPALSYTSFAKQDFTTSVTTSYTLDNPVANENELALFINFVRQEPTTAYTASGTSLTLTSATSASDDMYCVFLGKAVQTVNPPAGSVGASQIADGAVTSAKLGSNAIDTQALSLFNASGSAPVYACRAWVNFNGTGTVAIREDGNVTSITDNGTGDYTVNFTTAMPDINYCAVCSTSGAGANNSMLIQPFTSGTSQITPTTSALRIATVQAVTAITDSSFVQVSIFR